MKNKTFAQHFRLEIIIQNSTTWKKKRRQENKQTSIYMRNRELALALFTSIYAVFLMSSTKTMFETKNISDKNKQKTVQGTTLPQHTHKYRGVKPTEIK